MINGFDEQTDELSEYELTTLLPVMLKGLRTKIDKERAVTNKQMVTALTASGYKITDARVRKLINHIRLHAMIPNLIATSSGYYISTKPDEIAGYVESLKQRANAILAIAKTYSINP